MLFLNAPVHGIMGKLVDIAGAFALLNPPSHIVSVACAKTRVGEVENSKWLMVGVRHAVPRLGNHER